MIFFQNLAATSMTWKGAFRTEVGVIPSPAGPEASPTFHFSPSGLATSMERWHYPTTEGPAEPDIHMMMQNVILHIEEYAAAFLERTKLSPERIELVVNPSLDGSTTYVIREREEFDMTPSFYKKGRPAAAGAPGAGNFLKVSEEDAAVIAPMVNLDDLISLDQHEFWDTNPAVIFPCIGDGCPGCELGNEAKFKAFLPVMTKDGDPKIYAFGISVERQLVELEDELGGIRGKVMKVKRTGTGMKTKYMVVALGKSIKIDDTTAPDVIKAIGEPTRESIIKMLVDAGVVDADDARFVEPVKKPVRAAKPAKPEPEAKAEKPARKPKAEKAAEEGAFGDDDESSDAEGGWGSL
jgi:ribosomal protein L12E/L44/L45/RPP1/RPP2